MYTYIFIVEDWMNAYKIDYKKIDGSDAANKDVRNELFTISGLRGVYPQVFISDKASKTEFVGDCMLLFLIV